MLVNDHTTLVPVRPMTITPSQHRLPIVAIVGRPNVGKSTLFNRLVGKRQAVVSSVRGTTRDWIAGQLEWRGTPFQVIDTGGFEFASEDLIIAVVQQHLKRVMQEADGFVLLCDAQEGPVPADAMILEELRKVGKPILLAANKVDHPRMTSTEYFSLGLPDVYPISALHGRGIGDLLDRVLERIVRSSRLQPQVPMSCATREIPSALAIVGRQNVGKSSLLNALLREERVVVSHLPGTTRDAVDTLLTVNGSPLVLIDTAGLRHRRKVKDPVDLFSMSRTVEAIERCDVAFVVLDATQGIVRDDRRIIAQVCDAGRGVVLLANKWDLIKGGSERKLTEVLRRTLPTSAAFAPVLAVSATTGFHVQQSLTSALRILRVMREGMPQPECQAVVGRAWQAHPAPRFRGRVIHFKGVRWIRGRPNRLELTTAPVGWLSIPYQHYLLKQVSAQPRLAGVPIRLIVTAEKIP